MSWILDVGIAVVMLISVIACAKKGFVAFLFGAVGSVLAIVVSVLIAMPLGSWIVSLMNTEVVFARWIGVIFVAIILYIVLKIIFKKLGSYLTRFLGRNEVLRTVNAVLGGIYGLLSALFFIGCILTLVLFFVMDGGLLPNETAFSFLQSSFFGELFYIVLTSLHLL